MTVSQKLYVVERKEEPPYQPWTDTSEQFDERQKMPSVV